MDTADKILELIASDGATADGMATLREMAGRYPASALIPAMMLRYYRREMTDDEIKSAQATVALRGADRAAMVDFAGITDDDWSQFYPAPKDKTRQTVDQVVDTFMVAYGSSTPEDEALIEKLIFNPVPADYFEVDDSPEGLTWEKPGNGDEGLLSESLAKIFIKQGRFERAFEIISNINLKYPEKSAYFADQMRFLQKLIRNQELINLKKQ